MTLAERQIARMYNEEKRRKAENYFKIHKKQHANMTLPWLPM